MRKILPTFLVVTALTFLSGCAGYAKFYKLPESVPKAKLITHHAYSLGIFSGRTDTVLIGEKLPDNCGRLKRLYGYEKGEQVVETEVEGGKEMFIRARRQSGNNWCEVNILATLEEGKTYEVEYINTGRKLLLADIRTMCGIKIHDISEGSKHEFTNYKKSYAVSGHANRVCASEDDVRKIIGSADFNNPTF